MSISNIIIFATIVIYLAGVIILGWRCSKKNKGADDFYLGGRKLGPFVTAMSAEASDMSSYLLLGIPGVAYLSGLADATWTVIGLGIGTYLNWLLVAKRIRRYSIKVKAITIPEFFTKRYHDGKSILQLIAAIVIVVFFVPYTASGFAACGKLFGILFNTDYHTAMVVSALVIVAYTTLGGFIAASTTDFIQSIIMTIAIITILGFGTSVAGGLDAVIANAGSLSGYFDMFATHIAADKASAPYGFWSIVSTLAWGLGYFGMPHILLRFMAAREESELKLSRRIATVWVFISMFVAVAIGIVGLGATMNGAIENLQGSSSEAETVLIKLSELLASNNVLCAILAGVILAGVLAATMSTADSQLLAAASSVSKDIIGGVFKKSFSEKTSMLIARVSVAFISLIAIIFAWDPESSVFAIVSFAWAGFGAAFGPVVLLALFWKRSNFYGALAGMISGGAVVFIWKFFVRPLGGAWNIYELLPAFVVAILINVVVSLLTKKPDETIIEEFETTKF